jgi:hypothetical protein
MFSFIIGGIIGIIVGFLIARNNPNLEAANKAIAAGEVLINSAGQLIKKAK